MNRSQVEILDYVIQRHKGDIGMQCAMIEAMYDMDIDDSVLSYLTENDES